MAALDLAQGRLALAGAGRAAWPEPLVGDDPEGRLAAAITAALDQAGLAVPKGCRAVLGLGGPAVAVRLLSLPRLEKEEAREAVKWEAAQSLPFPVEEAVFDFHPFPAAGERMEVLFVAARAAWVEAATAAALLAGLEPVAVDLAPAALGRTLKAVGWARNEQMVATVELGQGYAEVGLFRGEDLVFSRVVPGGLRWLRREASAAGELGGLDALESAPSQQLAAEVQRSLDYYRAQHEWLDVEELAVTGAGAADPELVNYLGEATGIPTRVLPVAQALPARNAVDVPWDELGVAVGLALREVGQR